MSKIKLNPYVDLGLSTDQSPDLDSSKTSIDSGNGLDPDFKSISDVSASKLSSNEPNLPTKDKDTISYFDPRISMDSTYISQDSIKTFGSDGHDSEKNISVIIVVLLAIFLTLLGIVIYLALLYFSVI